LITDRRLYISIDGWLRNLKVRRSYVLCTCIYTRGVLAIGRPTQAKKIGCFPRRPISILRQEIPSHGLVIFGHGSMTWKPVLKSLIVCMPS
jgi:hypothetical protein